MQEEKMNQEILDVFEKLNLTGLENTENDRYNSEPKCLKICSAFMSGHISSNSESTPLLSPVAPRSAAW